MSSRAALISSAVSFLRDPSTAQSPLAQRIGFLESKGLTPQEIELALSQANGSHNSGISMTPYAQGGGPHGRMMAGGMMAREYERDWRDWFIMAVVGGSVGYVATKLAQKFIVPHLQPPSETDLEAAQLALEAKYDEASAMIKELQLSTDSLAASLDDQRADVEKELVQVRKAVEEMREGERRREEWSKKVGEQVDEVVRGLPSLIEKQSASQAQSLTDLQTELKSLKSLLIARRPAATPGAASPSTSSSAVPTTSSASAVDSSPVNASAQQAASSAPAASLSTSASLPSLSSTLGTRKPGIPAWQMRGSTSSIANGTGSSSSSSSTAPTPAPLPTSEKEDTSASGVLVEKPTPEDSAKAEGSASASPSSGSVSGPSVEEVKDSGAP